MSEERKKKERKK